MAEGIYYYDETAPVTRSHNDVLHYQRLDQKPATYLVELPGTLPLPPPDLQTRETRRGTSIVTMDQPTSEGAEQDEPLEVYLRTNLASFRKSLAPEDLKDIRRLRGDASGSVLVEAKVESRLTPPNETPADKNLPKTTLNDTLIGKEIHYLPSNEQSANKEIRNSPPNKRLADKEIRKLHPKQKLADKKERKSTLNEKSLVKKIQTTFLIDSPEHQSLNHEKYTVNNLINEKDVAQPNTYITATMAFKEDNDFHKYMNNEKRGVKSVVNEKYFNRSNNDITAMPMLTEQRGPIAVKKKDCKESRVKVHVMVDLLDDRKIEESRNIYKDKDRFDQHREPVHNDNDVLTSRSNKIYTKVGEREYDGDGAQQRPHRRSWSANSKRESIDRDNVKTPFYSYIYSVNEVSYPKNIVNASRRVPGGQKHNHRSRSASIRRYSDDSLLTQSTTNEINNRGRYGIDIRYDSKNNKLLGCIPLPPNLRSLKGGSRMVHKDENSFENGSLNDIKRNRSLSGEKSKDRSSRRSRAYGGYDGKRNDQSPKRNKADKPFSYDGMINCDIKDCPCRCHPDYDHSNKQKLGIDPTGGRYYPGKGKGYDPIYDGDLGDTGRPRYGKGRDYPDGSKGKGYDPLYDGDMDGKGIHKDGRGRDYPDRYGGKGYDPLYDGELDGKGRPRDGRGNDYPDKTRGKGYDPAYDGDLDGRGRPKDGRGRDYPDRYGGKGYDPLYDGDLDGKGRPRDGRGRDYPDKTRGKGYDPAYDGDLDGKGRPKDGRGRDYPDRYGGKGYDPLYDGDLDGKGRPRDGKGRGYPDKYGGKGYDPAYDGDLYRTGMPKDRRDRDYPSDRSGEKGYDPLYDGDPDAKGRSPDSRTRRDEGPDGGPYGQKVGFRPGDTSPLRRDSTPGDGSNVRGDDDDGRRGVLKHRAPKSATTLFTHRRYHIKIPDHNLQEPWFNARFSLDNEKNVDLDYQGPVKITNYYTSNRYE